MADALTIRAADVPLVRRTHYNMTNHSMDESQVERVERLRATAKQLASMIYVNCPRSRERSTALTSLEQALMWAVAAVAREEWETPNEG